MDVFGGISWRYRLYVQPHLLLHENMYSAISRNLSNARLKRESSPICYIFADASNVGDRTSAKGVSFLAGQPGVELFAAKAGLKKTFKTLRWLEENRPNTKILIGGGGLLQECFVPFWTELLQTKLQFALFGVGVNEMQGERKIPPVQILKELACRAKAIHVRDLWSQGLLQFGQTTPVTVGVCPSVNYLSSMRSSPQKQLPGYLFHVQHAVDVRLAGGDPDLQRQQIKELARDLNLIYDETDHIKENLPTLVKRYQRASLVISSRLHGCIFSYALGIPFVPIISDHKTKAFIDTHLPENPVVDVHFDKIKIAEKAHDAEKRYEYSVDSLRRALENNVSTMNNILNELMVA